MPIKVISDLPAKAAIEQENIFIMDENRAIMQDIRPLKILILNLMPNKLETEIQLLRALSNTPLQVDVTFTHMETHISKNTSASYLNQFYKVFSEVKDYKYDGMIITGAPVEKMEFEDVNYWKELTKIMDWTKENVTSTLHICWGAQAGLYYRYGIQKVLLKEKLFGVYEHKVLHRKVPLVRGFDDIFNVPHSRYTSSDEKAIHECKDLKVLVESEEAGSVVIMDEAGKNIFIQGHFEYDRDSLDSEYRRDVDKGLDIKVPANYYKNDDPTNKPLLSWRSHANNLYSNWLNYYVYQVTPYELK